MSEVKAESQATNGHTANGHATNGQSATNGATDTTQYQIPDAKTLQEVGELPIKDAKGNEILFKSLYENQPGRQLIVFIRHFYCGHCEEYVRYLSKHLPPSKLSTLSPPTTLTLIGCGDPICIPDYITRTSCPFPIYTDQLRALYEKLGMIITLGSGGPSAPEYLTKGVGSSVVSSLKNIVFSGSKGLKGGKYDQNGGEWIFEGGECKWVRRMKGTADHTLIKELNGVLGVGDAHGEK